MARKKKTVEKAPIIPAEIVNQPITETIETNYMPYAMSVIISRAIPEIDGFKPSHRKLLFTMYKMGLMTGAKTKSANIVGQTMHLNPHGDASIYETMVRLTRGHEALLHPFVDSKGSFGKQYSRDMAYAASRYTEAKLDPICAELFQGIDKNAVDLVPNYDNTTTEPVLLPTTFPNILVSPNMGIAVGLASNICSFNLAEVCDGTIALLKNPRISVEKMMSIIKAPDFSGGGLLIYEPDQMKQIFETGHGSVKVRAKYQYDKANNCIEILEIPYSTSIEVIIKKLTDMYKDGKLKEVTDVRDEIDLNGFKLTLDLRKNVDPDKIMARLYKQTTLQDEFACNFNILVDSSPKLLGIIPILEEWVKFRIKCYSRELTFELNKKKERLHLLKGLSKVLLDIDKAINIIRSTEKESDVIGRLMQGFNIDDKQAEYIAEIKLRHLNREYIINKVHEIENLQAEIKNIDDILHDEIKMKGEISKQLTEVKKKFGKPRKTEIIGAEIIEDEPLVETVEDYPCRVVLTKSGYFKKITMQSLRGNDEHRLKDGDEIIFESDCRNADEFLVFSDKCQVYKGRVAQFEPVKASALGDYLPSKMGFDEEEKSIMMVLMDEKFSPEHHFVFIFENGKGVRVPISSYETKSNRRRLTNAYSSASKIIAAIYEGKQPVDLLLVSNNNKGILIKSSLIPEKTTRSAAGVTLFQLKKKALLEKVIFGPELDNLEFSVSCRKYKIPATGIALDSVDTDSMQLDMQLEF